MTDDIASIVGCLLSFVICVWAVWFLATQLRSNVDSGTAVDQTVGEVNKGDAPGMFSLQVVGFLLLIGASALIGIGAIVILAQRLAGTL